MLACYIQQKNKQLQEKNSEQQNEQIDQNDMNFQSQLNAIQELDKKIQGSYRRICLNTGISLALLTTLIIAYFAEWIDSEQKWARTGILFTALNFFGWIETYMRNKPKKLAQKLRCDAENSSTQLPPNNDDDIA